MTNPFPENPIEAKPFFRRVGTIVLAIILFLLLAESLARIIVSLARPESSDYIRYDLKDKLASRSPSPNTASILFLGDSIMQFGIIPEMIESKLADHGLPVDIRNLAVSANSPQLSLYLLKNAIKHGNRPKLVFINLNYRDVSKNYLAQNNHDNSREPAFFRSYTGRCQSGRTAPWRARQRCFLERYSYLLRYRAFWKTKLLQAGQIVADPQAAMDANPYNEATDMSSKGWVPNYVYYTPRSYFAHIDPPLDKLLRHAQAHPAWYKSDWWTDALLRPLLDYCRQHRIYLVIVFMPNSPVAAKYYSANQYDLPTFYAKSKALLAARQIPWEDLHDLDNDPSHYADEDHLNTLGAHFLSESFTKILLSPQYRALLTSENKDDCRLKSPAR